MASSSRTLVATHTSNITANVQVFHLEPSLQDVPRLHSSDAPAQHATEAAVLCDVQAHILLRVVDDRWGIELTSLATPIQPIRFVFPSRVLPSPGIVCDNDEVHVLVATELGSVFRLVFPLPNLWITNYMSKKWREEYTIRHPPANLLGPVHVKEAGCILIGLRDGSILQLDASRRLGSEEFQPWRETLLRPPTSLSLSSFIPFTTKPQPGAANTVAFASIPSPSPSLIIFSLQRDRVIRVWESGSCVATAEVPLASPDTAVQGSMPPTPHSAPILDAEPQNLLQVIPPPSTSLSDEGLRVIAFMPSSSGGYFSMFILSARNTSGARVLRFAAQKATSEFARTRSLRDFLVVDNTLWVLWDDEGTTSLESTNVNFDDDDLESPWVSTIPSYRLDPLPTHIDDQQLPSHGSFTGAFLSFLLRPGTFSRSTLETALQQYVVAHSSAPGPRNKVLDRRFDSLSEQIAATVGCTVTLQTDPQTGEQQWNKYWAALRRDWEGFIARCVNIERSARWPLKLGRSTYESGDPLVIERERLGSVVYTDNAIRFYDREVVEQTVIDIPARRSGTSGESVTPVMELARTLRSSINGLQLAKIDASLLAVAQTDAKSSWPDIAAELARREIIAGISEELAIWIDERLGTAPKLEDGLHGVLNIAEDLDGIKIEDNEEGENAAGHPQLEWQKALTTAYITTTIRARHETLLILLTLICYIADARPDLFTEYAGLIGGAFSALQCVATMHTLSQRPSRDPDTKSVLPGDEDMASMFQTMHVSNGTAPDPHSKKSTPSLLHLVYSTSHSATRSFSSAPGIAAHQFLRDTDALNCGEAPGARLADSKLLQQLWVLRHPHVVQEMAEWFPRTPAIAYVLGRSLLDLGRVEDAATSLERVEAYIERDITAQGEETIALAAVLPPDVHINSAISYFRHLVGLFEKTYNATEVVHFARLAISHSDPGSAQDLWLKSHKALLDLGQYEDAYATMTTTPFPELQRELTRNLVNSMCDNDQIERLVSFNFVGYQNDVEETLAFKARNADPRQKPHYSEVLHAWYVFRGDFRSAAASMYQHAQRLADIVDQHGPDAVEAMALQAKSLLASINALSLVDQRNAWIQYIVPSGDGSRRRHHHRQSIPEQHFQTASLDIDVVTLSEMKQEYALTLATLQLVNEPAFDESGLDISRTLRAEEIVSQFMQWGMFDQATSTARSLKVDMTPIFASMTSQCMRLSRIPDDRVDPAEVPWLMGDRMLGWEGTNIQRAWRLLRTMLDAHDSLGNGWAYRKAVLARILEIDRHSRVPSWLVDFFEEEEPEYLIRSQLKYGLVEEALRYTLNMVRKASQPLIRGTPEQSSATWLPYTLIDQVLIATEEEQKLGSSKAQADLAKQLRTEIDSRTKKLSKWKAGGR
ncbi:hypothetical protein DL93DRAFT_2167187 [Clavulina sp. PMI_390]|nr:hypothetical protein DL93DRAFT_2167187 [Clavulina sp. PMI_390]